GNYLDFDSLKLLKEKLSEGVPSKAEVSVPYIDCDDVTVLKTYSRYSSNQILAHIIGYMDSGNANGVSGLEKGYNDLLNSFSGKLSVSYLADARGRILSGSKSNIKDENYNSKGGIKLTIDSRIQRIAEECANESNLGECAIVILEANSGKIRAMVSKPDFNPQKVGDIINAENSPLINRALTPYSVGSVFKLVVAAAAVEKGIPVSYEYDCRGEIDVDGVNIHCHKLEGHGTLDMSNALALSCNTYFINLALKVGKEDILGMAEKMGFGKEFALAPEITGESGILPDSADISSQPALANLAFGQGTLMATPLQLAVAYSCVANSGKYYQPFLVESTIDANGNETTVNSVKAPVQVFSKEVSDTLTSFLENSVNNGGGSLAKPTKTTAAGKTATAQTGWYDSDGKEYYHSWFCGFYPSEKPKYIIAIMKEKGKGGSVDCAPVFKKIADKIEYIN
ncbi:MAG: penicillin-binding protein 2, partial [Clostridiales bacterium]|nr:penicillin-binding protein 2 [Clostridiales bacterium]